MPSEFVSFGVRLRAWRAGRDLLSAFGTLLFLSATSAAWADPPAAQLSTRLGQASWYGEEFAWRPTASGQLFDPRKMTGAHRTLPLGCKVRVTNLRNGRSVLVTINDRGPYIRRRDIDLSYGAARVLGMVKQGLTPVLIEPLES